jgi:hypothetical protein
MILAGVEPALGGQLVDLALGDDRRGPRQDLQHLQAAVLDHQFEASREQEIADQHARRIAPDDVGGALAAPEARAVDDVVVEEGGSVDELDRGGKPVVPGAGIIEQSGAGQGQHRPHPLAAAGDQMTSELGNQGDVALHPVENDGIDVVEVGGDQLDHRIECRRPLGADGDDRGGHDGGDLRRDCGNDKAVNSASGSLRRASRPPRSSLSSRWTEPP